MRGTHLSRWLSVSSDGRYQWLDLYKYLQSPPHLEDRKSWINAVVLPNFRLGESTPGLFKNTYDLVVLSEVDAFVAPSPVTRVLEPTETAYFSSLYNSLLVILLRIVSLGHA